jgi:hypothetical protein
VDSEKFLNLWEKRDLYLTRLALGIVGLAFIGSILTCSIASNIHTSNLSNGQLYGDWGNPDLVQIDFSLGSLNYISINVLKSHGVFMSPKVAPRTYVYRGED